MDEKALLEAIGKMMDDKLEPINERLGNLEAGQTKMQDDITTLKADVSVLKDDVSVLKDDVSVLKDDVSVLKDDVSVLKDDVAELKDEAAITRHGTNLLLKWAEKADRTSVNVGLYGDE